MYTKLNVNLLIADIYNDTYAKTDNIFEIQKIRAMSANFPIIADAVLFYDGIMGSHFESIAPNIYSKTEIDTWFENIDLSSYYDKTEVGTLLTNTNLTGSENIDITNNQISSTSPMKVD